MSCIQELLEAVPVNVGYRANDSFSKSVPLYQVAWDSTSLGTLMECPRKYFYSIVLGKTPRAESVHLTFGTHYHAAHERFHHARAAGADHEEALREAILYAMTVTWDERLGRGWTSDIPEKNRLTLVRTLVWYYEQFRDDPLQTIVLANGKPAVELSFRAELLKAQTGEGLYLCGHLDRLVEWNDDAWITDYKTTKSGLTPEFFSRYSPDNQFSVYTFASDIVYSTPVKGLIVDVAQVGVTFSRFQRGLVHRTKEHHEEWFEDFQWWTTIAYDYAEAAYWPMNTKSCGNYGGCPFRSVCAKPPSIRPQWLAGAFTDRQWNPLKVRGDI